MRASTKELIRFIGLFIVFLALAVIISGCATSNWEKIGNSNKGPTIHQMAEFYDNTYPYCSEVQKAMMFAEDLKRLNIDFDIVRSTYQDDYIEICREGTVFFPTRMKRKYYTGKCVKKEVTSYNPRTKEMKKWIDQ